MNHQQYLTKNESSRWIWLLAALFFVGFMLSQALGAIVLQHFYGTLDFPEIKKVAATLPHGYLPLQIYQIINSALTFLFPALILFYRRKKTEGISLFETQKAALLVLIYIPGLLFTFLPLLNTIFFYNSLIDLSFLGEFGKSLMNVDKGLNEMIMSMIALKDPLSIAVNFIMIVVMAAVAEEVFFRGVLQTLLIRKLKDEHWGIFFSGFIFSAVHMQVNGFFPRMALGILFGYMYAKSGRLSMTIIAHALFNGMNFMVYFMMSSATEGTEIITGDENQILPASMVMISTLIFIFTYFSFLQFTQKKV